MRVNGKIFEWVAARLAHRDRRDLYHSALQVHVPEGQFVIEQAPAWSEGGERGVVGTGAVGARPAGRFRLFRYEVRRWHDGLIPDVTEAVESPQRLSTDPECARRLLELVPQVPTPVWGRDELGAGEMWNSNSTISWLIARSGLDVEAIALPRGNRLYAIREVTAEEAGPVLKRYVAIATKTRRHFRANADAPVEAFVAEADRHPVFELTPLNADAG